MPQLVEDAFTHSWALWVMLGIASAVIEVLIPSFTFIFVSFAALVTALASLGCGWGMQIGVFGLVLLLSVLLLRPKCLERFQRQKKIPSRAQALLGRNGQVTEAIDPLTRMGRVTVDGQDWAAHCDQALEVGKAIRVDGSDGIILTVKGV